MDETIKDALVVALVNLVVVAITWRIDFLRRSLYGIE